MNRAQRRAAEARAKMSRNANRVHHRAQAAASEFEDALGTMDHMRGFLFAAVRAAGRLRIRASELAELGENDRLDFVPQENGDVILEYVAGAKPAPKKGA